MNDSIAYGIGYGLLIPLGIMYFIVFWLVVALECCAMGLIISRLRGRLTGSARFALWARGFALLGVIAAVCDIGFTALGVGVIFDIAGSVGYKVGGLFFIGAGVAVWVYSIRWGWRGLRASKARYERLTAGYLAAVA